MLQIVLVRHGETYWNRERRIQGGSSDTQLTEAGKRQAEDLAQLLEDKNIAAIYSSPLQRALDTAQAVARFHPVAVTIEPNLREIEVGELEGMPLASLSTTFDQFLLEWQQGNGSEKLPGGESLADLAQRAWTCIQRLASQYNDGVVVVVTHYFVILTIICEALGMPLAHIRRLRANVGGISILDFGDKKPRLVVLNDTCHLTQG